MSSLPSQFGTNRPPARVGIASGLLNISPGPGAAEGVAGALFQTGKAFRVAEEELNKSRQSRLLAEGKGNVMREMSQLTTQAVKLNDPDKMRALMKDGLADIKARNVDALADEQVKDRMVGFFESTAASTSGRMLGVIADRSKKIEKQSLGTQARETANAVARLRRLGQFEEANVLEEDLQDSIEESRLSAFDTDLEADEFKRATKILVQATDFQSIMEENPVAALEAIREGLFEDIEGDLRVKMERQALAAVDQAYRDDVAILRREDANTALLFVKDTPVSDLVPQTADMLTRSLEEQLRVEGRSAQTKEQQAQRDVVTGVLVEIDRAFAPVQPVMSDEEASNFIVEQTEKLEAVGADQQTRNAVGLAFLNRITAQRSNAVNAKIVAYESDQINNDLPTTTDVLGDQFLGLSQFSNVSGPLVRKIKSLQGTRNATVAKQVDVSTWLAERKPIPSSHRDAFEKTYNATVVPRIKEQLVLQMAAQGNDVARNVAGALAVVSDSATSEDQKREAEVVIANGMSQLEFTDLDMAQVTVGALKDARMMPLSVKQAISKGLRSDDPNELVQALAIYRDGVDLDVPPAELVVDTGGEQNDVVLANTFVSMHLPGQDPIVLRNKLIEDMKPTTVRLTQEQQEAVDQIATEDMLLELRKLGEDTELFTTIEEDERRPLSNEEVLNLVPQDLFTKYLEQSNLEARNSVNPQVARSRVKQRVLANIGITTLDGKPRVMWQAPEKVYADMNFDLDGTNALQVDMSATLDDMVRSGRFDLPEGMSIEWRFAFPTEFVEAGNIPTDARERARILSSERVQANIKKWFIIRQDPRHFQRGSNGALRPQYMILLRDPVGNEEPTPLIEFQREGDARTAKGYARWRPSTDSGIVKDVQQQMMQVKIRQAEALKRVRGISGRLAPQSGFELGGGGDIDQEAFDEGAARGGF